MASPRYASAACMERSGTRVGWIGRRLNRSTSLASILFNPSSRCTGHIQSALGNKASNRLPHTLRFVRVGANRACLPMLTRSRAQCASQGQKLSRPTGSSILRTSVRFSLVVAPRARLTTPGSVAILSRAWAASCRTGYQYSSKTLANLRRLLLWNGATGSR